MDYRIRRSEISDIEKLGIVHSQVWHETYAGMMPDEKLATVGSVEARTNIRRQMFARMTPRHGHFLVENFQGQIVGFGDSGPAYEVKEFAEAEIYTLYLLRCAQRQRIGGQLLHTMLDHLASQGFQSVGLKTHINNLSAQKFYHNMGGESVSLIKDSDGEDEYVYVWTKLNEIKKSKP